MKDSLVEIKPFLSQSNEGQINNEHGEHAGNCCSHTEHEHSSCSHSKHEHSSCSHSEQKHDEHAGCCCSFTPLSAPPAGTLQKRYYIQNMDCPMEEGLIRKKLAGMSGVHSLNFNLIKRVLTVYHNLGSLDMVEQALDSIAMYPKPLDDNLKDSMPQERVVPWKRLTIACVAALAAELVHLGSDGASYIDMVWWLSLILALTSIALGGLDTYKKGWISLKNLDLNMNALMSFAVTGAMLIGRFPEAAMVMVLFTIAEIIEDKSITRARKAIEDLMTLTPEQATIQLKDGNWETVDSKTVPVDSIVRVKPGERIALDGIVTMGSSAINQAPITGESLPVDKNPGDTVYAGTINESSALEYRTIALAANSTIARIIYAVEEAQQSKAPIQRFVDQFARIYTPIVFILAILVAVLPPIFFGTEWFSQIYKALILLVIACPCALVISTPVSIVSALASATRHGLLVKGGAYLEQGRKLTCIALDKTGTLTKGIPALTDVIPITEFKEQESLLIAASLAARSDHPVSKAIANEARAKQLQLYEVTGFTAIPGKGIYGIIEGKKWYLGNNRILEDAGSFSDDLQKKALPLERSGKSIVFLTEQSVAHAIFAVADTIRDSSIEAISQLKRMGIKTVMLTGDNAHTAQAVANQVGIDIVKHSLLPQDKLKAIIELSKSGQVGMVGDGINDAPALAKAHIGFAMASMGTDTAIETADVAIMNDDIRKIPIFISLSRSTFHILTQNIVLAIGIKSVFFVLTLVGETTMWMAVFADVGTSFLVVANGLRLLRK